jgi:hypothetical protein
MVECYCLKEKKIVELKNVETKSTKNGRKYIQGQCVNCGCKCNKFLKNEISNTAK